MTQYNWTPYAIGGATRADAFTGMTPEMQSGLYGLLSAADKELGGGLQVYSGYRSPELQAKLYQDALKKYGSPEKARKWVAPPGRSKHNTGQAADLKYNGVRIDKLPENHPARQWLRQNVARFGLAQPMSWEPWQVEVAGARGQKPSGQAMSYGATVQNPQNPLPNSVFSGQPMQLPGTMPEQGGINAMLAKMEQVGQNMVQQQQQPQQPIQPMPRVQQMQFARRNTAQPYLQFFRSLMR